MLANLSTAQRDALNAFLRIYGADRPSLQAYQSAQRALRDIPAPNPKSVTAIPNCDPGRHGYVLWSMPLFIPSPECRDADLPEGLALFPVADSAGNHALHNAASVIWTHLWNYWNGPIYFRVCEKFSLQPCRAAPTL